MLETAKTTGRARRCHWSRTKAGCEKPAEYRVQWAEGMAVFDACEGHVRGWLRKHKDQSGNGDWYEANRITRLADSKRVSPESLRSATDPLPATNGAAHAGSVAVLLPVSADAAGALVALARSAGVEQEADPHVTLIFLGKVGEDIDEAGIDSARKAVASAATDTAALRGVISGVGKFAPSGSSDGKVVLYASPDVPGLAELRSRVQRKLAEVGVVSASEHGHSSYITVAYVDRAADLDLPLPETPISVEFTELAFSVGKKWDRFALVGKLDERSANAQALRATAAEFRFDLAPVAEFHRITLARRKTATPGVSEVFGRSASDGKERVQGVRLDRRRFDQAAAIAWWAVRRSVLAP